MKDRRGGSHLLQHMRPDRLDRAWATGRRQATVPCAPPRSHADPTNEYVGAGGLARHAQSKMKIEAIGGQKRL